eukprot:scaffold2404_cov398-Prasinococcus_capsulatus_cf.AAC.12
MAMRERSAERARPKCGTCGVTIPEACAPVSERKPWSGRDDARGAARRRQCARALPSSERARRSRRMEAEAQEGGPPPPPPPRDAGIATNRVRRRRRRRAPPQDAWGDAGGDAGADAAAYGTKAAGLQQPPSSAGVEERAGGVHGSGAAARVLARWILQTYGVRYLTSRAGGVLDVAGGKGQLSLLLANCDPECRWDGQADAAPPRPGGAAAIRCTVVDPRRMDLDKAVAKLRRWKQSRKNPRATGGASASDGGVRIPSHWPIFWERDVWERGVTSLDAPRPATSWHSAHMWEEAVRAFQQGQRARGSPPPVPVAAGGQEYSPDPSLQGCWKCRAADREGAQADGDGDGDGARPSPLVPRWCEDGFSGWSQHKAFQCPRTKRAAGVVQVPQVGNEEGLELLDSVCLIVGLHPDQATDAIVDFALEKRIPFAVVPCCTYHRLVRRFGPLLAL